MSKQFFIILLLNFICNNNYYAINDSCLKINDTDWKKVTTNQNFTETFIDDTNKETKTEAVIKKSSSIDFGNFKYIFYFLVGGAILFILVKILLNLNTPPNLNKSEFKTYTLQEVEDKILEIDLEHILNEAINNKDFRLALRINFLIIIKTLTIKKKISWAKEKTNGEYLNEIVNTEFHTAFKNIVATFEPIWYGEYSLNEMQFYNIQPNYQLIINQLNK